MTSGVARWPSDSESRLVRMAVYWIAAAVIAALVFLLLTAHADAFGRMVFDERECKQVVSGGCLI